MKYKEKWSPRASSDYDIIITYLLKEWTQKEALKFIEKVEKTVALLLKTPKMFKASIKNKQVRQCVMLPQVSLYYRISHDTVEIIALFDNRQSPSKLKI